MKYISTPVLQPDPSKRDLAHRDEMVADFFGSEDNKEVPAVLMEMR